MSGPYRTPAVTAGPGTAGVADAIAEVTTELFGGEISMPQSFEDVVVPDAAIGALEKATALMRSEMETWDDAEGETIESIALAVHEHGGAVENVGDLWTGHVDLQTSEES